MDFNDHSKLIGKHAFLSPSNYHWINYDSEKFEDVYLNFMRVEKGTRLHAFAAEAIRLGVKLPRSQRTLNLYVNDAIGYKMTAEQVLYYSPNCFGTADAICFRDKMLRIHDLKTGETPASINQLEIYTALFCLEYDKKPDNMDTELRIYQSNQVLVHQPESEHIYEIMDKIVYFDKRIEALKMGA